MKYDGNFISFIAVAVAYWAFMLTDGALRMLVLLHFHQLGISPLQLAYIFLALARARLMVKPLFSIPLLLLLIFF